MSDGWGNPIVGGTTLRIPAIQSPDFVEGVSGWFIGIDGSAEFNNLTVRGQFLGTDFIINSSGIFFYSGTPGSGNLIMSAARTAGTDSFGNAVAAGWAYYGTGAAIARLSAAGPSPAVLFTPASVTDVTEIPQISAFAQNAGLVNERYILQMLSGKASGNPDAGIQLFSAAADNSAAAQAVIEFGGVTLVTMDTSGLTVDSWHLITLDAGWTAGSPAPAYRLDVASGNIQFTGNASHAGFTVGTNINGSNPLPSGVRPANPHYYRSNDNFRAGVQYLGSGVLEAFPAAAGNTQVDLDGIVSLR